MKHASTAISIGFSIVVTILPSPSIFAADRISIQLAHNRQRERETSLTLKQILGAYDLHKYTFTREVIIEERAMNHAFAVLTLNVFLGDRADMLRSTYVHEQLHWYLGEHGEPQKAAIIHLHQMYPHVPVGLPQGADSEYSTYGHLVDCYLDSGPLPIDRPKRMLGRKSELKK